MCVSTITDATSINAMKIPQHLLLLASNDVELTETWEGERLAPKVWLAGTPAFLPADTELDTHATSPYSETTIRISDRWFREASVGDVDYNRIELRYREVVSCRVPAVAAAVRSLSAMTEDRPWPLLVESLTLSLTAALTTALTHGNVFKSQSKSGLSRERKRRVLDYIDAHLHRPITLSELSTVAALSQYHFARSFTLSLGVSPLRYLLQRRVRAAKRMLGRSSVPLSEVAADCGFTSQSHFTTAFRTATGASPRRYRLGA